MLVSDPSGLQATVRVLIGAAFFCLLLSENSRIPVDDPNTHLELTMIHEVMVLDHGGPDFGLILYTASLKLWLFSALVVHVFLPSLSPLLFLAAILLVAVVVGVAESVLARLRMGRVTQFLAGAGVLNVVALILVLKG
jgi:formate hydrogenlyase subunit 4